MPRVGSSKISTSGRLNIHFASTTFCWLPPERLPAAWKMLEHFTPKRFAFSPVSAISWFGFTTPPLDTRLRFAIEIFRLIVSPSTRPQDLRSSGR